ncbi:MAG: hypothetical protein JJW01_01885 [Alphaproteobacteria bacterium]|nr:hypothetical protein [Rickettsiales bacterium]
MFRRKDSEVAKKIFSNCHPAENVFVKKTGTVIKLNFNSGSAKNNYDNDGRAFEKSVFDNDVNIVPVHTVRQNERLHSSTSSTLSDKLTNIKG